VEVTISELKAFGEGKGYGFNVFLEGDSLATSLQLNGFRVYEGGINPPSLTRGRGYFPAVCVSRWIADHIYDALLAAQPSLKEYIQVSREQVIMQLMYSNFTFGKFNLPVKL
jgi:hypothetical protein